TAADFGLPPDRAAGIIGTMKALVATAFGPPERLSLVDIPPAVPGPGQVVVLVRACGVNFPDALIIEGKYQLKPSIPFAPGCEVAGVIARVGPDVADFEPGDRVAAVLGFGGFAEEVVVDARSVVPLPPNVDDPTGSAVLLAHGTSLYALADRARIAP